MKKLKYKTKKNVLGTILGYGHFKMHLCYMPNNDKKVSADEYSIATLPVLKLNQ